MPSEAEMYAVLDNVLACLIPLTAWRAYDGGGRRGLLEYRHGENAGKPWHLVLATVMTQIMARIQLFSAV